MYVQKTNWGYIKWFNLDRDDKEKIGMNVGIVTLNPKAHQLQHTHYDSQIVYFLEGTGYCIIDGEKLEIEPKKLYFWPAGVVHEIYNEGDGELKHILVSNPKGNQEQGNFKRLNVDIDYNIEFEENNRLFNLAIEAIRTQFLGAIKYSYSIYDIKNRLVKRSKYMPKYCYKNCENRLKEEFNCCLLENSKKLKENHDFHCKYGVRVLSIPIIYGNRYLGYIQGGYFLDTLIDEEYYIYPESSIEGIRNLLVRIVKAIVNYCEFYDYNRELESRDILLTQEKESQQILIDKMKQANNKILEMKINNHFLFNTLNFMASMALERDQWNLYESIINLSRMFQYNQKRSMEFVRLSEEVEYINSYLELQKNRYGDNLEIQYSIDEDSLDILVPFNFLQPIVENIFEHGFINGEKGLIKIIIDSNKESYLINIINSGKFMSEVEIDRINIAMKSEKSHGLSMIYDKLENTYNDEFSMKFKNKDNFTKVEIVLPVDSRE